jgi:hypothetical protein
MSTTSTQHIPVAAKIVIDLNKTFTMESLYETVVLQYPKDPTLSIVGISVPIINYQCKEIGIIDPIKDIKEAIARLYNNLMTSIVKPIWNTLYGLYNALKRFGLGVLDLKLPVFDLTISDLFASDLYDRLKAAVLKIYESGKDKLKQILALLKIPYPFFTDIQSPEIDIEYIVKSILSSLWDTVLKLISKIIGYIKTGLLAWDLFTKGLPVPLSPIWSAAIDAILAKILALLALPPSMKEIYDAIVAFVTKIIGRIPTYEDIMKYIKDFKLPIFGNPFDWKLPLNFKVNAPNIDVAKILGDIKIWMNTFLFKLLAQFMKLISKILSVFGLSFLIPTINIPLTLCAIEIET